MGKRLKYEEVKSFIEEKACELITNKEEYKNAQTKLKIKCECGNYFSRKFSEFKKNNFKCTLCTSGTKRYTYEEVKDFIMKTGSELISTSYKNNKELMKIKCSCGNIFDRNFANFKDGKNYKCPRCGYHSFSYEEVSNFIKEKGGELISKEYINNETKLDIRCSCGDIYRVTFGEYKFKKRFKCPKCNNKQNIDYDYVKKFIESKGCSLISKEYNKNSEKLEIKCKCGEVFERRFNNFKDSSQYYCNSCAKLKSKGELSVIDFLNNNNIKFKEQYKFKDCKFKKPLPFDFYLYENNILIEYDGIQHFEKVDAFGGEEEFKIIKKRDSIKTEYAKNKSIKLIRIPYTKFKNIDDILIEELNIKIS